MDSAAFIMPNAVQPRAFFCIPVEESLATRSTMIADLMDTHGTAELPEGLDMSDVMTWAASKPGQADSMSWEALAHTLKVFPCPGNPNHALTSLECAGVESLSEVLCISLPSFVSSLCACVLAMALLCLSPLNTQCPCTNQ